MIDMKATIVKSGEKNKSFVVYDKIVVKNGRFGIMKEYESKEVFVPQGTAIILEKIFIDISTLERIFILSFVGANGDTVRVPFPRKNMTEQGIMELLAQGAQINKRTAGNAIISIFNQEPDAPCEMVHCKLGFSEYNKKIVFLGSEGIGVSSLYQGELKIKPSGDFTKWKEMCKTEIIGTPMEFILAVAGTAPILDYFRKELHIGNIIVSLVGESSTGKTTAGCLGVSAGSKCSFQGDSMVATFADSQNSLMHSIHSAFPMLIDEGSLLQRNPTNLIYALAEGKEKGRLTQELKKAESITFSTAIFMTSEKSILQLCDKNTGLLIRCLEIEGMVWTKSAESADIIKKICEENYGFLVPRIAERLLTAENEGRKKEILEQYDKYRKEIVSRAKEGGRYNPLTERFAKTVAVICLGSDMVSEILDIKLDIEMLLKMIEEHSAVSDCEKIDIGERAMSYLCQYISVHYTEFVKSREGTNAKTDIPKDCKGRMHSLGIKTLENGLMTGTEMYIAEIILEKILREGGFQDKKVVLKRWKEAGYLHCDKDRYVSKIQISEPPNVKGYRIYIPTKNMEEIEKCVNKDTGKNDNSDDKEEV